MFIALIIIVGLTFFYHILQVKIPISIYMLIASFPYKNIIEDYCPWLDSLIELLFIIEVFLFIFKSFKGGYKLKLNPLFLYLLLSLLAITMLYSIVTNNILFIFQNGESRFYIGTYILITFIDNTVTTRKKILDLCNIFITNASILSFFMFIATSLGKTSVLFALQNKNMYAMIIYTGIFMWILKHSIKKETKRGLFLLILGILVVALYLVKSSAALLSLLLSSGIGLIYFFKISQSARVKTFKIILFLLFLISTILIWITINDNILDIPIIKNIMMRKGYLDTTRISIWREAFEQFQNHWLYGLGADSFRSNTMGSNSIYHYATHNDYISYLVNYGILGFIAFTIYSITIFNRIFSIKSKEYLIIFFAILTGFYLYMLTHNFINYIIFWVISQMILTVKNLELDKEI